MLIHSPKDLGVHLLNIRQKLKLSQEQVADLVGLTQKTISNFENNPERAEIGTFFRILSALELSMNICPRSEFETGWKEAW